MAGDTTELGEWWEIERKQIADCRIFTVERSIAVSPGDGEPHEFHRIQSPDWVQLLPITSDGNAVLVRQYRHGAQRLTLEVPAGLIEPGEDPAAAGLRECLEETGYRAHEAVSLGVVNPNPALFANRLYCFYATGATLEAPVNNIGTERTEPVLVPVHDLEGLLLSGEIDHALVVATLWRYLHLHVPR